MSEKKDILERFYRFCFLSNCAYGPMADVLLCRECPFYIYPGSKNKKGDDQDE